MHNVALLLLVALPAVAQQPGAQQPNVQPTVGAQQPGALDVAPFSARFPSSWYPTGTAETTTPSGVSGKPYRATVVTMDHYVDQQSGKVTTKESRTLQARDSMGRTHVEFATTQPGPDGKPTPARDITVTDPVSHCDFEWREPWIASAQGEGAKPVASVTCRPRSARLQDGNLWSKIAAEPAGEISRGTTRTLIEKVTPTIESYETTGIRNTSTTERPDGTTVRLVLEWNYAPELDELIRSRQIEPANGPQGVPNMTLTNILRVEPDPKLFYPPIGYRIESSLPVKR